MNMNAMRKGGSERFCPPVAGAPAEIDSSHGSAGSIYPTLQQLQDEKLITSDRQDGRRVYSLTAAGRKELERAPDAVRRIWERAEQWGDWGSCMGPETMAAIGPLTEILKAA